MHGVREGPWPGETRVRFDALEGWHEMASRFRGDCVRQRLRSERSPLALGALCIAPSSALAQQTREELAAKLPASNLSGDAMHQDVAQLLAAPGFARAVVATNPEAPEAKPVGEHTCIACHQLESEHFTHTLHSLGLHAANKADPNIPVCETCHGPGSAHAQNPTAKGLIIGYTKDSGTPIETQTKTCLTCHARRPARSLARLGASAQRAFVQRLPQPDGEILGRGPAREGVDQRHLRAMPSGHPHAVQPPLAHAAAGRPDELRRLPQPARLADQSAA